MHARADGGAATASGLALQAHEALVTLLFPSYCLSQADTLTLRTQGARQREADGQ
jgi:hypothetical protein